MARTSLIIEDDPDASDILADLVRERGLCPVQSFAGQEGLELARRVTPDIIFLDVMLPDLDGYKVCEALKLDRRTNPIPVVMVTALSAEENRLRGFRVGADAYVSKPYTPDDIARAIETARQHRDRLAKTKVEHFLHFDLASEVQNLQSVNELLGIVLKYANLTEEEVVHLRTALQEMGQNAIEWGNRYDPAKLVKITCHVFTDRIEITVADEGDGFDPGNLPHASDGGDDPIKHLSVREMLGIREGGFGILIVKGLMDDIRYNETGNAVTLVKRTDKS